MEKKVLKTWNLMKKNVVDSSKLPFKRAHLLNEHFPKNSYD